MHKFVFLIIVITITIVNGSDICDVCRCSEDEAASLYEIRCKSGTFKSTRPFSIDDVEWPDQKEDTTVYFNDVNLIRMPRLRGRKNIIKLSFDDNQITTVLSDPFKAFSELRELSCANNSLRDLPDDFLRRSTSLVNLNLSRNLIKKISPAIFENTKRLKEIDLSYNQLETISTELIANFIYVEKLNFAHNKIVTISDINLENILWKELDLSGNQLTNLNESFKKLRNLKSINLAGNFLKYVEPKIFMNFINLESLDLSENAFDTMNYELPKNLVKLNFSGNFFVVFPESVQLPESLSELYLQRNCINELIMEGLHLPDLTILNLSSNNLTEFINVSFSSLKTLDLSNNYLTEIPPEMMNRTPSLKTLILDSNSIEFLNFNDEITFEEIFLRNLTKLNSLTAEINFQKIKPSSLSTEEDFCFHLTISDCPHLTHIEPEILGNISLCSLDLSNNNISVLPDNLIEWSEIKEGINLQSNPFDCSCDANWMVIELLPIMYKKKEYQYLLENFKCAQPQTLENIKIIRYYKWPNAFCPNNLYDSMDFDVVGAGLSNIPANRRNEKMLNREPILEDEDTNKFQLTKGLGLVIVLCTSLFAIVALLSVLLYMIIDLRKKRLVRTKRQYKAHYSSVRSTVL